MTHGFPAIDSIFRTVVAIVTKVLKQWGKTRTFNSAGAEDWHGHQSRVLHQAYPLLDFDIILRTPGQKVIPIYMWTIFSENLLFLNGPALSEYYSKRFFLH